MTAADVRPLEIKKFLWEIKSTSIAFCVCLLLKRRQPWTVSHWKSCKKFSLYNWLQLVQHLCSFSYDIVMRYRCNIHCTILTQHYLLIHWTLGDLKKKVFTQVIFKLIIVIDGWGISCEIALRWMSLDITDDKLIGSGNGLVPSGTQPLPEPMLPRSVLPNGVTGPQWVNLVICLPQHI